MILFLSLSLRAYAEDPLADFLGNESYDRDAIVRQLSESERLPRPAGASGAHPLLENLQSVRRLALVLPVESRGLAGQVAGDFERGCRHGVLGDGRELSIALYSHDGNSAAEHYEAASRQGADVIIGPMLKRGVESLTEKFPEMPVPTLLLQPAEGYFVMSLDAAQEASDLARLLRESWEGTESPLIVVQPTPRGEQLAESFSREWLLGGGFRPEYFRIEDDRYLEDPLEAWRPLFDKLKPPEPEDDSEELPPPPPAVPVYAAGDAKFAEQTRNFSPQRNPVYASSTANTGADPSTALLLENLGFMEMPWFSGLGEDTSYDSPLVRTLPVIRQRFFVLGADACRAILDMPVWSEGWELRGLGGTWTLRGEVFTRRGVLSSYRGGFLQPL